MDKIKIAHNLVELYADYQELFKNQKCSYKSKNPEYSESVAQAILLLSNTEEGGASDA